MNNLNTIQKYGIIGLMFLLIFPSILNFNHVFAHESNVACNDHSTTHLHQSTIDCDLCSYHPTPIIGFQLINFNPIEDLQLVERLFDTYKFLSDYQKLSFVLRGPPSATYT